MKSESCSSRSINLSMFALIMMFLHSSPFLSFRIDLDRDDQDRPVRTIKSLFLPCSALALLMPSLIRTASEVSSLQTFSLILFPSLIKKFPDESLRPLLVGLMENVGSPMV